MNHYFIHISHFDYGDQVANDFQAWAKKDTDERLIEAIESQIDEMNYEYLDDDERGDNDDWFYEMKPFPENCEYLSDLEVLYDGRKH